MIILPQQIESFTSSTLHDDFSEYNPDTTYTYESDETNLTNASVVRYGTFYWRSFVTSNEENEPKEGSAFWSKYGVSNKQAMLDLRSQTKSTTTRKTVETSTKRIK